MQIQNGVNTYAYAYQPVTQGQQKGTERQDFAADTPKQASPTQENSVRNEEKRAVAAERRQAAPTAFESTTASVRAYQQAATELRRSESINTYVDNSGSFTRVGERASVLPVNQLSSAERESVRYVGRAHEGAGNPEATASSAFMLARTTQAISAYNAAAQSAKSAQTHSTYLQNSVAPLNIAS